jgi:hypothetical protein
MTGDALLKQGKPANTDRMTNPSAQPDVIETEVTQPQPVVVVQRTGTDDHPTPFTDNGTTGVTMASRTPGGRSTTGAKGIVTPATGSKGNAPRQEKDSAGGGGDEPADTRSPRGTTPSAQNDNDRAIDGANDSP